MEAAFGADFSTVRVHVGPQAERIGAIAFTLGSDIYFAPGRFQPDTAPGRQLLGHELAHVLQQRQGRVRNPTGAGVAVVHDRALEAEADRMGHRAASHRGPVRHDRPTLQRRLRTPVLQRYEVIEWDSGEGEFLAQELGSVADSDKDAFLKKAAIARVSAAAGRMQLRISDDRQMAIEDSNLSRRQPKTFYAAQGVIDAGNAALETEEQRGRTGEDRLAD